MTGKFKVGKTSKEDYKKFLKKAEELAKHAERYLNWVKSLLP